ncbi:MAG: LysM peptidoglycan-binding domain-containing protein [Deltaproteobacteria bacterium]|nr:MAG: LysM peptidoglycan-binding domain-containing protein [Deltaproteobacteria bacterium]
MKRTVLVWIMVGALLFGFSQISQVVAQEATPSAEADQETYIHVVVKGDTLWDICEGLYGNPWVWPKVWQLNPHITNPHWIYPGTELRVYYEIPKFFETVTAMEETVPEPEVEPEITPPPPPPPLPPKAPSITFSEIDQVGFITPFIPKGDGLIVGEERQRKLIGAADKIYLQFQKSAEVEEGNRFFVFKTSEMFRHPVTNKEVGYLNTILGVVEVTEVSAEFAKAMVRSSYESISPGDKLMPYRKRSGEITFEAGAEPIEGNIILARGETFLIGDRQIVFIDLGEADDIKAGNRFEVFRDPKAEGSFAPKETKLVLSAEPIGELLVLAVEQETAAALVTKALFEFTPGERIRLKTGE